MMFTATTKFNSNSQILSFHITKWDSDSALKADPVLSWMITNKSAIVKFNLMIKVLIKATTVTTNIDWCFTLVLLN